MVSGGGLGVTCSIAIFRPPRPIMSSASSGVSICMSPGFATSVLRSGQLVSLLDALIEMARFGLVGVATRAVHSGIRPCVCLEIFALFLQY